MNQSLSKYIPHFIIPELEKENISNLNSFSSKNIISAQDINNILSSIQQNILYISALVYSNNGQFGKFIQIFDQYIIDLYENSIPHVIKFNNLYNDVGGVISIKLNDFEYQQSSNHIITINDYLITYKDFPNHIIPDSFVTSFNGITSSNITGASGIIINNKYFYYNIFNQGIINLNQKDINIKSDWNGGYVQKFNNLYGNVSGALKGLSLGNNIIIGSQINVYSILSNYINDTYLNKWITKNNFNFNNQLFINTPIRNLIHDEQMININYFSNNSESLIRYQNDEENMIFSGNMILSGNMKVNDIILSGNDLFIKTPLSSSNLYQITLNTFIINKYEMNTSLQVIRYIDQLNGYIQIPNVEFKYIYNNNKLYSISFQLDISEDLDFSHYALRSSWYNKT